LAMLALLSWLRKWSRPNPRAWQWCLAITLFHY